METTKRKKSISWESKEEIICTQAVEKKLKKTVMLEKFEVEFIPNITGSILFTSATLFELPSVTKSAPTDIIMIIGMSKLHNQITKLVSLECKF